MTVSIVLNVLKRLIQIALNVPCVKNGHIFDVQVLNKRQIKYYSGENVDWICFCCRAVFRFSNLDEDEFNFIYKKMDSNNSLYVNLQQIYRQYNFNSFSYT